jgi:hypothetical protein
MNPVSTLLVLLALTASPVTPPHSPEQVEYTSPTPILDRDGMLATAGWSRRGVFEFDKSLLTVPKTRLRQWDFFTVMTPDHALNITLAHIGFAGFCSVDILDMKSGATVAGAVFHLAPDGNVVHRATSEDTAYCLQDGKPVMILSKEGAVRTAWFDVPSTPFSPRVRGRVAMQQPDSLDYLALVLPFPGDQRRFFYENKIPGLTADGVVEADGKEYRFRAGEAYAVMDWGRGVWPQNVFWRWGAANSENLSFNLGNGFGDTSKATENIVVVNGKTYKLGELDWFLDRSDYKKPWRFVSSDGKSELTLEPLQEQVVDANALVVKAELHKVYGYYSGRFTLPDGTVVPVERVLGFAEEMGIVW